MKWYAREVLVCIWFVCFRQCSWLLSHFAVCKEDRPTVHPCFLSDDLACSVWPCVSTPPTAAVHHVPHCDLSLTIIHCGWLFGDPVEILRLLCIKSYTVGFPVPVVFKLILLANCLIICVIHDKLLVDLFFLFLHIFVHVLRRCGWQTWSLGSVWYLCVITLWTCAVGRSVTSHSGEGIHKTEVFWADQWQVILVKGSIRLRCSRQVSYRSFWWRNP